jgi:putative drug exporter of the RND superfamily
MPVTTWVPMFLFVILFGLSMDYEVFLISRIREEYDVTGDNAASVARGLARTARVITAAAAIMVVVFLSFVLGSDVAVKQIGLGLAVATPPGGRRAPRSRCIAASPSLVLNAPGPGS